MCYVCWNTKAHSGSTDVPSQCVCDLGADARREARPVRVLVARRWGCGPRSRPEVRGKDGVRDQGRLPADLEQAADVIREAGEPQARQLGPGPALDLAVR